MLREKLSFRPERRGNQDGYRFTGEGTVTTLLTGLVPGFSQAVASLTFVSWNQVGDWLRRLEALRRVA